MTYTKDDTIFVQIASYCDPELRHTLRDLFKKAKKPENIFVGVCYQHDMDNKDDEDVFKIPFVKSDQIRVFERDYRENGELGVCWSRNQAQSLYEGEKWVLQIDSHMRFLKNWDEVIVTDIKKINNGKNICFTAVPPSYHPTNNIETFPRITHLIGINKRRAIGIFQGHCGIGGEFSSPMPGIFIYACFVFGDSVLFDKPYIPNLLANDEHCFSIKVFMNGGKIYYYNKNIINHFWVDRLSSNVERSNNAFKHDKISDEIMLSLIVVKKSNKLEVAKAIDEYQLGEKRTIRSYERFAGVNFRTIKRREHTQQGVFEEWKEVANIASVKKIFQS
jgi:hypothetical protein